MPLSPTEAFGLIKKRKKKISPLEAFKLIKQKKERGIVPDLEAAEIPQPIISPPAIIRPELEEAPLTAFEPEVIPEKISPTDAFRRIKARQRVEKIKSDMAGIFKTPTVDWEAGGAGALYAPARLYSAVIERPAWGLTELAFKGLRKGAELVKLKKPTEYFRNLETYYAQTPPVTKRVETTMARSLEVMYEKDFLYGLSGTIAESATDLLGLLTQLAILKKAPATLPATALKTTNRIIQGLANAGKIGTYKAATTQGELKERFKMGVTMMAYNITPHIANATGATGNVATAIDTALNTFLTAPTYIESAKEAENPQEFLAMAIPQFVMDIGMALSTRGTAENQRTKALGDYIKTRNPKFKMALPEFKDMVKQFDRTAEANKIEVPREELMVKGIERVLEPPEIPAKPPERAIVPAKPPGVPIKPEIKPKVLPKKIEKIYEEIETRRIEKKPVRIGRIAKEETILGLIQKGQEMEARKSFIEGKRLGIFATKEKYQDMIARAKERTQLKSDVNKLVSDIEKIGKRTKELPREFGGAIDQLLEKYDLKRRTKLTLKMRNMYLQAAKEMQAQGENVYVPRDMVKKLGLERKPLNLMTLKELRDIHYLVMQMNHIARIKNKTIAQARVQTFDKLAQEGKEIIRRRPKEKPPVRVKTSIERWQESQKEPLHRVKVLWRKFAVSIRGPSYFIIDDLDKGDREGTNTKMLWQPNFEASKKEYVGFKEGLEHLRRTVIGEGIDSKDIRNDFNDKHKVGKLTLSINEMMYIYAHSFNAKGLKDLYESGISTGDIEAIKNELPQKRKDMVKRYFDYTGKKFSEKGGIEDISLELTGSRGPRERFYIGMRDIEGDETWAGADVLNELMGRTGLTTPTPSRTQIKKRTGARRPFKSFSFYDNIVQDLAKLEHLKAFALPVRDANKYLSKPEVKNAIIDTYGVQAYDSLRIWLDDTAKGYSKKNKDSLSQIFRFARENHVVSVLGGSVLSALKAPVSIYEAVGYAGEQTILDGAIAFADDPAGVHNFVRKHFLMVASRANSISKEIDKIVKDKKSVEIFGEKFTWRQFKEKALFLLRTTDGAAVDIVSYGVYKNVMNTGKFQGKEVVPKDATYETAHNTAVRLAEETVMKTQPMGGVMHLPGAYRAGELGKLFTLFTNQLNKNYNLNVSFMKRARRGEVRNKMEYLQKAFWWYIMPAFTIGLISRGRLPKKPKEVAYDTLNTAFVGGVPIVSQIFGWWMGERAYGGLVQVPIFEDIARIGTIKNVPKKIYKGAAATARLLTGFPVPIAERTIKGTYDIFTDLNYGIDPDYRRIVYTEYRLKK